MKLDNHIDASTDDEHTRRIKLHGNGYHYDNDRPDRIGEFFRILGQVHGDWSKELFYIEKSAKKEIWGSRKENPDTIYSCDLNESTPILNKIVEIFKLTSPIKARLQLQKPGGVMTKHHDDFTELAQPEEKIVRFLITLATGEPGQIITFGNTVYHNWKAGEIIFANYEKIPHATANVSWNTRPLLSVTGVASPETINMLAFGMGDVYLD